MRIDFKTTSWVDVTGGSDFPIQNLPFGVVRRAGETSRVIRIGDKVVSLGGLEAAGLLSDLPPGQDLSRVSPADASRIRASVGDLLQSANPVMRDNPELQSRVMFDINECEVGLPIAHIPAFVDFYSSENHASNVGRMFRPQSDPLLPNWKHIPIGYNGRASTVIPSGVPILRPNGQRKPPEGDPTLGPTRELDFELELGFFIGKGNEHGQPVPIDQAESHMLGLVLVNDWSARDVQRWEYQPLGPFLAKSFATSISPWVVTLDALEPFRCEGQPQSPEPLDYLRQPARPGIDLNLEVWLQSPQMAFPARICRTNFDTMYWSMAQQLAHQTINGTRTEVGDLYASGTISGKETGTYGSMLELAWRGETPIRISDSEERVFLQDGDTVIFKGWCEREGVRVGFGELTTQILPAKGV